MKEKEQWVLWSKVQKGNGKPTKIPYQISGETASTNKPETWAGFEDVCKTFSGAPKGKYDGIGFVFNGDFVGIDLDDCIVDGVISPEARSWIDRFDTYTEISQSGRGVHIISTGRLPGAGKKVGNLEIYGKGRYFAITGNVLEGRTEIKDAQDAVLDFYLALTHPDETEATSIKRQHDLASAPFLDDDAAFRAAVLATLLESPGVANDYNDFLRLGCALKAGGCCYSEVDPIFASSERYDANQNEYIYNHLEPKSISFSTAYYYAKKANPDLLQSKLDAIPKKCRYCGGLILWRDKKPFNEDGTRHNCRKREADDDDGEDDGGRVNPGLFSRDFFNAQEGRLMFVAGSFWRYLKTGVWSRVKDKTIATEIKNQIADRRCRRGTIEDILYQVTLLCNLDEMQFNPKPYLLNFQNGVLDIHTGEWLAHSKEYYQTTQLPIRCDLEDINKPYSESTYKAPQWHAFLKSLKFSDQTLLRLQEWIGYCLVPVTFIEKSLFLKGEGSNGKSVFLETLGAMLGNNVSNLEITELFDRFKIAEIQGKLVNFSTDIESSKVFDARWKKLVSGEKQSAEYKFKDPFEFRPSTKFLFSANDFIPSKDRSYGFFRRFDILEFTEIFTEDTRDERLKEKLRSELQGIFRWAYFGLKRLVAQNWKMTKSPEMDRSLEDFKMAVNPLKQFLEECYEFLEDGEVSTQDFRSQYSTWCTAKGYEILSEGKLGRELKKLSILKYRKENTYAKKYYFYKGLKFIQ